VIEKYALSPQDDLGGNIKPVMFVEESPKECAASELVYAIRACISNAAT
jgi:hypothetical protein